MSFIEKVQGGLIVSCQALPDEPLHSSFIMARMALAAEQAGAVGIRANSVVDIQAIQDTVQLPIIGIIKKVYRDEDVFITPTMKEVRAACATGVEVVAMDATTRRRPDNETLPAIIEKCREEFPDTLLMADTATIEDVIFADELGFDLIGTTLHGYTKETQGLNVADHDFEFLKEVLKRTKRPVIAEGKFDSPEKARRGIELGCHSVVSGGAITRPQEIAKKFVDELSEMKKVRV